MEKIKEAKLSAKGQITVPKEIRKLLNVKSGECVAFYIDKKEIKITAPKNLSIKAKNKAKEALIAKDGK